MKKQIDLSFLPEDSGNKNFTDIHNCPIAQALKRAGYTGVRVGGFDISVNELRNPFPVTKEVSELAQRVAEKKILEPIEFKLEIIPN